jgi:hypothetical protein
MERTEYKKAIVNSLKELKSLVEDSFPDSSNNSFSALVRLHYEIEDLYIVFALIKGCLSSIERFYKLNPNTIKDDNRDKMSKIYYLNRKIVIFIKQIYENIYHIKHLLGGKDIPIPECVSNLLENELKPEWEKLKFYSELYRSKMITHNKDLKIIEYGKGMLQNYSLWSFRFEIVGIMKGEDFNNFVGEVDQIYESIYPKESQNNLANYHFKLRCLIRNINHLDEKQRNILIDNLKIFGQESEEPAELITTVVKVLRGVVDKLHFDVVKSTK